MKTSVALCTYNGEKFLKKQIDSILNQTIPVDEIVICDDVSTDSTVFILNSYKEKFPTIFKIHINEKNLRSVKNFEKAISLCENEIIFLCDQDDFWKPEKVSLFLEKFRENSEIDVFASNANIIDDKDKVIDKNTIWDVVSFLDKKNIQYDFFTIFSVVGNLATGANMAFRKSFISNALPFPEKYFHHDEWISLFASSNKRFGFLQEKPSFYRIHETQQVGGVFFDRNKNTEMSLLNRFNVYNECTNFGEIKRKIRSVKQNRKKFILANKFNKNQVFSEALRIINNFEINLKKDLKSKSYLKFLFFKLFYFQK